MLQAAANIFMEQGFEAASMEAVAKAAGISKKTIYAFVETKEQLFEEVMKAHVAAQDRPRPDASPTTVAAVEDALADFLSRLAHFILGPFAVGLFRLTIAESERFPHIAQTFYREGALRSVHQLEDWLQLQHQKGLLDLEDVHEGAVMLTSMVILEPLRAAALGVAPLPGHDAMEKRAHTAARIFVRGVAAR
jgi:AcrR family transcriptional regulator